jgi:hypothetical protein
MQKLTALVLGEEALQGSKHTHTAFLVLTCGSTKITEALGAPARVTQIFSVLNADPPLNCRHAACFRKLMTILQARAPHVLSKFLNVRHSRDAFSRLLTHLDSTCVAEVLGSFLAPQMGLHRWSDDPNIVYSILQRMQPPRPCAEGGGGSSRDSSGRDSAGASIGAHSAGERETPAVSNMKPYEAILIIRIASYSTAAAPPRPLETVAAAAAAAASAAAAAAVAAAAAAVSHRSRSQTRPRLLRTLGG